MKKFIKNTVAFFLFLIIFGEIIVRVTHSVTDLPKRIIDEHGIQKYYPNQTGYWKGGSHKWIVNKLGWPGQLPDKYDNLITVIGDSFIENFMNPNECHQSILLKKQLKNYNFIEAARSGVSFIEAMEITKQFDSLRPKLNLIYVGDSDFYESVSSILHSQDITQLNLEKNSVILGKMKSPGLKKILYNWKLLYYFYNRFPLNFLTGINNSVKHEIKNDKSGFKHQDDIERLLIFVKKHYDIHNKMLVFHPNSELKIIEICKKSGFQVLVLNSKNDKTWTFEHDSHWTCYGHNQVAKQVAYFIKGKQ